MEIKTNYNCMLCGKEIKEGFRLYANNQVLKNGQWTETGDSCSMPICNECKNEIFDKRKR